ncbi:MAG: SDR family NAD(P)-dependent oxidoreductase, partial [Gammaproteobacteria bacterium]|nr:SDR family NAD(P)-dependent oxidoreductase [Gammaproteobacteria bacterium]
METFQLNNKHVVITGASSGFGHHFSRVLANAGARVVLGARRMDKIEARVAEIRAAGGEALGVALDVRDHDSIDGFLGAAEQAFGPIDVVINNAG